jgi:Ca2+-binding RTX toxin-like protein
MAIISATTVGALLYGTEGADQMGGSNGDDRMIGCASPLGNRPEDYAAAADGDGDDRMNGGAGNDTMQGMGGNDTMIGGSGNDWIGGGSGADWLSGGSGHDTFYFGSGDTGNGRTADRIVDFDEYADKIDLRDIHATHIFATYQHDGTHLHYDDGGHFVEVILDGWPMLNPHNVLF